MGRRKIRLKESNAKCRHLKKLTCKGSLKQVFICLRPPLLLGFCFGWSSNFVGSESGQIQSIKLLQKIVSNRTPYPPPLKHCILINSTVIHPKKGVGGGRVEQREGESREGHQGRVQITKMGCKYQHD
jgi:hypothetical protein